MLADRDAGAAARGFRHPAKKPAGGKLTEAQPTYNKVIHGVHGIHGVCERANSLLRTTFKALRRVSLDPSRITEIASAARAAGDRHLAARRAHPQATPRAASDAPR